MTENGIRWYKGKWQVRIIKKSNVGVKGKHLIRNMEVEALEEVLKYLTKKYRSHIFTLSEAMLESLFTPEDFGEAIRVLVTQNILVLSTGGSTFSAVTTKKGDCTVFFDVTNDESWQRWKHSLYSQGFTNEMREKIKRMHSKIPFRGKYRMDFARIRLESEWGT